MARYNGWTNYETWAAALWIDNDEGSQRYWHAAAQEVANNPTYENEFMDRRGRVAHQLCHQLYLEFEEQGNSWMSDQISFFADIFNKALGQVEWYEIAEHLLDGVVAEEETPA